MNFPWEAKGEREDDMTVTDKGSHKFRLHFSPKTVSVRFTDQPNPAAQPSCNPITDDSVSIVAKGRNVEIYWSVNGTRKIHWHAK